MKVRFNCCKHVPLYEDSKRNNRDTGWGSEEGGKVQNDEGGVRLEEEGEHSKTSEQGKESVDRDGESG